MSKSTEAVVVDASGALCAEIDPELWFPSVENASGQNSYEAANYAKSVCARCPLSLVCLTTALRNKEDYGIWGGATPNERKKIKTTAQAKKFLLDLQDKADHLGSLNQKRKRLR